MDFPILIVTIFKISIMHTVCARNCFQGQRNKPTQSQIKLNKVNKVLGFLECCLGCKFGDQQGLRSRAKQELNYKQVKTKMHHIINKYQSEYNLKVHSGLTSIISKETMN